MDYEERVEYYGKNDLIYGYMFNKSIEIMKTFDEKKDYSINEILEFYNVLLHLQDFVNDHRLTPELKLIVNENNIRKLNATIGKFFSTISNNNFIIIMSHVDFRYRVCIWKLIEKYNVYKKISAKKFSELLVNENIIIERILENKKIVIAFDNEIRDFLINNARQSVDILIKFYFSKKEKNIYLPKSLSLTDKEQIFSKYIESENVPMGTLETIANLPVNKECKISDFTRAKALEKHKALVEDFFKNKKGIYFSTNIKVSFSKTLSEFRAFDFDYSKNSLNITVSEEWIKNNLDYPTLLNNFIHIFGLVDSEFRISNISKPAKFGLFERIFINTDLVNNYQTDEIFQIFNKFAIIEVEAYSEYLKSQFNIRVEDILQWFFDTYLEKEFDIKNFFVTMPSAESTYLEKCRTICSEMESMVKQYNLLAFSGYINHDVIEISSIPVEYSKIKSLIVNKYLYLDRKKCNNILYLLFSDQAMLSYLPKRKKLERYNNFFDLLSHNKLNISEYEEYQVNKLKTLQKEEIISISQDGNITFKNMSEAILLHDIYTNEFATTYFYKKHKLEKGLQSLENRDWIIYDSCLLSKQESDYFNYYLNKSIFTNGFDLRNKYLHGTQRKRGEDEELHKMNYYTLLMLFILLVIKINEELCVNDEIKKQIE